MDNKEILEYIRILRERANNNKLIVFVGAGVSCNVEGLPDWNTLIKKMAESIKYTKCSNCGKKTKTCHKTCKLKEVYSTDEYLKIPQYVYNKSKRLYRHVLAENIVDVDVNAPLSNAIVELEPAHIITTNYDKLIEKCESAKQDNFEVIINDKDLLNSEKKKYIIKMHGDVEYPDTIVLKEADYLEYSQKHVLIEMFVKSLLTDHTILFLGYSLNDYNIKLIISWINYIRMQNKTLNASTKFGYIVVDKAKMTTTQKRYFEKNNIGVINIHNMPLIEKMPEELKIQEGKRLYSFLKTIKEFSLEKNLGQILLYEKSIDFMRKYKYIDCKNICKLLCLGQYYRVGPELTIFSDFNYDYLIEFMENGSDSAEYLKQKFSDAGITTIGLNSVTMRVDSYVIKCPPESIIRNELYQLYLCNNYTKLMEEIDNEDVLQSCLYLSIIEGYSPKFIKTYSEISYEELSEETKIVYLFNKYALDKLKTIDYKKDSVTRYINGVADAKHRDMMQFYLDTLEGNTERLLIMRESLEKLREQYRNRKQWFIGCSSLQELYKIKSIAYEQYMFYFYNNVFFVGYSDLKKVLEPYIEAVVCANGQFDEEKIDVFSRTSKKEKYCINKYDIDILTKFISLKEFNIWLEEYNVDHFAMNSQMVDYLIECFNNLSNAIVTLGLCSSYNNALNTFINYMQLILHIELSDVHKSEVVIILKKILSSNEFVENFFSLNCPEWRLGLKILNNLLQKLSVCQAIEIVKRIVNQKNFWNYYVNVSKYDLEKLFNQLIYNEKKDAIQKNINKLVDSFEGKKKIDMIGLLKKCFDETSKEMHKVYIFENYHELSPGDILDFFFADWLKLSEENIEELILETIQIYNEQKRNGYNVSPNPIERNLELINLLYIIGEIKDLRGLEVIKEKNVFLQFFLDEENFDYDNIDFSHYMWQNIARQSRFMDKIAKHKEAIIPNIQKRIQFDTATEFEKKILYGYLMEKEELLK